jgi:hypothetical protein
MIPDIVNGSFELGGALTTCLSVRRLWRDRRISGVHWAPTIYFTSWGAWNIWYYPTLGQWFSMLGGIAMAAVNLTWLLSLLWFIVVRPRLERRRWQRRNAQYARGVRQIDHPNCRCVLVEMPSRVIGDSLARVTATYCRLTSCSICHGRLQRAG